MALLFSFETELCGAGARTAWGLPIGNIFPTTGRKWVRYSRSGLADGRLGRDAAECVHRLRALGEPKEEVVNGSCTDDARGIQAVRAVVSLGLDGEVGLIQFR